MELKIYITPTCSWCQKLKLWLKKKKVSFQELDVVESEHAREEMISKSGQMAVPVIEIDGKVMVGFHEHELERVLSSVKDK